MTGAMSIEPGMEPYPGYRIVHLLGTGGWGEVWKAERTDGTEWALKFLPGDSQLTSSQEIRALQAIRELRHPNLIRIEQVWCGAGAVGIVMELADGSLQELFEVYQAEFNSPITQEHLCYYLSQAAASLDFLNTRQHRTGGGRVAYRHCDVKPSNLLVHGNTVKVADFSLAVPQTATMGHHRRAGTLHYAAPEVFQGWLSDRTDQYSLAVTYVQLRTGALPFPDSPPKFDPKYVRPVPELDGVSPAERGILLRALAPVPQNRWPSCAEMMRRLSAAVRAPCLI